MNNQIKETAWYQSWFDSPYYHILYKHRDFDEATQFVQTLISFLNLPNHAQILDLACGKGRHSIQFNKAGFSVTGLDLSPKSIQEANQTESKNLAFYVHDMRDHFRSNYYDLVVNLFTSFGYFENLHDNERVLSNIHWALKPKGLFVLDYFNSDFVKNNLVSKEVKIIDGIEFKIQREIVGDSVQKHIQFIDQGQSYSFTEEVKLFSSRNLVKLIENTGFKIKQVFGHYHLNPFQDQTSPRVIIIAQK
jgi:SAM-dependent methyltransferase